MDRIAVRWPSANSFGTWKKTSLIGNILPETLPEGAFMESWHSGKLTFVVRRCRPFRWYISLRKKFVRPGCDIQRGKNIIEDLYRTEIPCQQKPRHFGTVQLSRRLKRYVFEDNSSREWKNSQECQLRTTDSAATDMPSSKLVYVSVQFDCEDVPSSDHHSRHMALIPALPGHFQCYPRPYTWVTQLI